MNAEFHNKQIIASLKSPLDVLTIAPPQRGNTTLKVFLTIVEKARKAAAAAAFAAAAAAAAAAVLLRPHSSRRTAIRQQYRKFSSFRYVSRGGKDRLEEPEFFRNSMNQKEWGRGRRKKNEIEETPLTKPQHFMVFQANQSSFHSISVFIRVRIEMRLVIGGTCLPHSEHRIKKKK